ncbi:MAG: hypothetical protein IKK34_05015 [Clostridia bacterium]|nr:hypothetical protein [Clostridia bacterium]
MKNTSKLNNPRYLKGLLIVGLVLMAAGAAAGYLLPLDAHLATTIAGMASGVGSSFALIGGVFLFRRWRLGEVRARDAELAMTDERGLAVAYKAQNVAAVAAVFAMIAIMLAALVRGDEFYALMGSVLLIAVALIKLAAWHIYNRKM